MLVTSAVHVLTTLAKFSDIPLPSTTRRRHHDTTVTFPGASTASKVLGGKTISRGISAGTAWTRSSNLLANGRHLLALHHRLEPGAKNNQRDQIVRIRSEGAYEVEYVSKAS